jgi:hypothetical protein
MGELDMPTFDTPNPITATVTVVGGDVRIAAGDAGSTTVTIAPTDTSNTEDRKAAEQTRVEYTNGHLLVRAPKLRSWLPGRSGGSVDVTIELPAGSTVHAGAALADFTFGGPLAEARIKTGLGHVQIGRVGTLEVKTGIGDISVDRVTGHADISSGSGEVRVRELDSGAVIKNANGSTWVGQAGGDLRVSAANGSIAIDAAQASVVAKSANGDVRLGEAVRNSVVLETSIGDLEVGIPAGTAAWLDVRAAAGKVHNSLDAAAAPDATAETVEVRARTTVGDVVIRRS